MAKEELLTDYRVRVFDGTSRKRSRERALAPRRRRSAFACRQHENVPATTLSHIDAPGRWRCVQRGLPDQLHDAANLVARRPQQAWESEEDLLIAVMGLLPGPWTGPGSL